jgi:hypothetical protein
MPPFVSFIEMKFKVGITVVIFVLISLTLIIFRKHLDESLFQLFSLIGSLASLFGLLFVWLQTSDVTEGDITSGKHLYALLAIWIVIGLFLFWSSSHKQVLPTIEPAVIEKMVYPLPDKPSIAVLPFDNMTGDISQDYLSDGISENIISALSGISNLFVIARNSTFTYKDKPVSRNQGVVIVSLCSLSTRLRAITYGQINMIGNLTIYLWFKMRSQKKSSQLLMWS